MKIVGFSNLSEDYAIVLTKEECRELGIRIEDTNDMSFEELNGFIEKCQKARKIKAIGTGGSVFNSLKIIKQLNSSSEVCVLAYSGESDLIKKEIGKLGIVLNDKKGAKYEGTPTKIICIITGKDRTFIVGGDRRKIEFDRELLKKADYLLVDGYTCGEKNNGTIKQSVEQIKKQKGKVVLSPAAPFCIENNKKFFLGMINEKQVDILVINKQQGYLLFDIKGSEEEKDRALANKLKTLSEKLNMTITVSNGKHLAAVYENGKRFEQKAVDVNGKVVDTTGAGDAFVGGFLSAYSRGVSASLSLKFGILFGSRIIQKYGSNFKTDEVNKIMSDLSELKKDFKSKREFFSSKYRMKFSLDELKKMGKVFENWKKKKKEEKGLEKPDSFLEPSEQKIVVMTEKSRKSTNTGNGHEEKEKFQKPIKQSTKKSFSRGTSF